MSYGGYQQGGGYPPGGDYPQGGGYPPPGGYQPGNSFPPPPQYGYGAPPMPYADMGKRFVAAIIDSLVNLVGAIPGILVMIIGGALGATTADSRGRVSDEAAGAFVLFVVLGYIFMFIGAIAIWLYNIYLLGRDGATFGKRFMKIKVLDPQGRPLGFGKAFLRELVKGIIGQVCLILWFWPLWDPEKQGLHDKIFSTHVYNA